MTVFHYAIGQCSIHWSFSCAGPDDSTLPSFKHWSKQPLLLLYKAQCIWFRTPFRGANYFTEMEKPLIDLPLNLKPIQPNLITFISHPNETQKVQKSNRLVHISEPELHLVPCPSATVTQNNDCNMNKCSDQPSTPSSAANLFPAQPSSSSTPATTVADPQPSSSSSSSTPSSKLSLTTTSSSSSTSVSPCSTSTASECDLVAMETEILDSQDDDNSDKSKKSLSFGSVTIYHFTRSQGFISIPSQGGSTLGMKRRHFRREKLSVNLFEEVRRRSRREILLKIKYEKERPRERVLCSSISPSTSNHSDANPSSSATSSSSSTSVPSDTDEEDSPLSDYSDISDSELESDLSFVFCQPIDVKLRRSLLRASGIGRIDPKEKWECKFIRESRERSGCRCVNQCIPGICECSLLGVNCHVDRASFPCGCISEGCRNPLGRTEFDIDRVKGHSFEKLLKSGIG